LSERLLDEGNYPDVGIVFGVENVTNCLGVDVCPSCKFPVRPAFLLESGGKVAGHSGLVTGRNVVVGVGQRSLFCFGCEKRIGGLLRGLLFRHSRTIPAYVNESAFRKLSYPLSTMLGMTKGRISELVEHTLASLETGGFTNQSQRRIGVDLKRLGKFLTAHDLTLVTEIEPSHVNLFVVAPARNGDTPAVSTQRNRRLAARILYRSAVQVHPNLHDFSSTPTVLRRLSDDAARPLTSVEIGWCRQASLASLHPTRLPAVFALAEATATTGELPKVRVVDIDFETGTVHLAGGKATAPRVGRLTDWGAVALNERVRDANLGGTDLVAYEGGSPDGASGQASCAGALTKILGIAGLANAKTVGPASVRAHTGLVAFQDSGRIEDAARVLGCLSLDTAARLIGFDWRQP
jgi:integrase